MKTFNYVEAFHGAKVVCRNGREARIICFDRKSIAGKPITALLMLASGEEVVSHFFVSGAARDNQSLPIDLFMKG